MLLGHENVKTTQKYYAAWTEARQRQVEADLERAWARDPIVLAQDYDTQSLHEKTEAVN